MTGQSWTVYCGWIEAFEKLSPAELGRLTLSAMKYSAQGETPELPGNERFIWPMIKSQIDADNAHRLDISAKRKASGALSHSKKQMLPNATNSYQLEPIDSKDPGRKERSKEKSINNNTRFIPPSVEEVEEYCRERNNDIDAQHFIDYYASNGWRVGKNPMKDWRATVRNWERSDSVKPRQEPKKSGNIFLDMLHELGETDVTI